MSAQDGRSRDETGPPPPSTGEGGFGAPAGLPGAPGGYWGLPRGRCSCGIPVDWPAWGEVDFPEGGPPWPEPAPEADLIETKPFRFPDDGWWLA